MRDMCKPAHVQWATGTDEEYAELCKLMVKGGKFIRLNEKKRPNSFLCRSDPADIAHVEKQTFICTTDCTTDFLPPLQSSNQIRELVAARTWCH